jgi:hypothetical protein
MVKFVTRLIRYIAIALVVVPLSIVTHEFGHFVVYKAFGASNVVLHAFSVSAEKDALSSGQIALAAISGPIITYMTLAAAIYCTHKNYIPFWVIAGLAAPIGRIVNFIYVYFRAAGYDPNPNFDEFNFSRAIGVDPLGLAAITCVAVVAVFVYFLRAAWKASRYSEIFSLIVSIAIGLVVWSSAGPLVLP